MDKNHKDPETIDLGAPRLAQYIHKAWRKHQNTCIGSTSTLWRKDWSSIKHYRTPSFFIKRSQLLVSRELFWWKLEKSYTRRFMRHLGLLPRSPWNMTGGKNWMKKFLDDQRYKLCNNEAVPSWTNQIQTQVTTEGGNLLFVLKEEHTKLVPLVKGRTPMQKMKQNTIERWNPLFAVLQMTNNQCETRFASTSEIPDCHILLWNKLITVVYVNLSRRSRTNPHRQPLQRDLKRNNAHNPLGEKSKKMIQDMGNVELFELFETEPKTQCKECLFVVKFRH